MKGRSKSRKQRQKQRSIQRMALRERKMKKVWVEKKENEQETINSLTTPHYDSHQKYKKQATKKKYFQKIVEDEQTNLSKGDEIGSYEPFYELQQVEYGDDTNFQDLQQLILKYNPFTSKKYQCNVGSKLDPIFYTLEKYQQIMKELVKIQLLSDIQQRLEKRAFSLAFPCKFQINQEEDFITFTPKFHKNKQKQQSDQIDIMLMKGKRLGFACDKMQLTDEQLKGDRTSVCAQLCFLEKSKKNQTIVAFFLAKDQRRLKRFHYFFDLDTIVTHQREIAAISNLDKFQMNQLILDPTKMTPQFSLKKSRFIKESKVFKTIVKERNLSQVNTIYKIGSCSGGIHFIQGPPGTGKTSTILSIVAIQLAMVEKKMISKGYFPKKMIMMCSQSNAAIDDVCVRLSQKKLKFRTHFQVGIDNPKEREKLLKYFEKNEIMRSNQVSIIRIGKVSLANENLLKYNLGHISERIINPEEKSRVELQIDKQRIQMDIKNGNYNNLNLLKTQINQINKKIVQITQILKENKQTFQLIQRTILQNADILLTTLSSSGRSIVKESLKNRIRCVLIDEAGQATEPSILIPMQLNPRKVVLIGDPRQLAPTVLSQKQGGAPLCQSLFQRCLISNIKYYFLDTQYRMNPMLSSFANHKFYEGRLKNGPTRPPPQSLSPFINQKEEQLKTLFFFDLKQDEQKDKVSFINKQQATIVANTVLRFIQKDKNLSIGVITPYKAQAIKIEEGIKSEIKDKDLLKQIKVSTVDAFQGQERNIIIFSTVRSNELGEVGFLRDQRRLNVSLTRAQNIMITFGNAENLKKDSLLGSYVSHTIKKGVFYSISSKQEAEKVLQENLWKILGQNKNQDNI